MTIDDLKTLMDDFDPATLLPELGPVMEDLLPMVRTAVLAGPVILLVMGLLYLIAAPKEANYHFGYRCYFGMGSVDAWRFTQRLAGIVWSALGLVLLIVMLLVSGGFARGELVDVLWTAVRCVLWEVGLVAVSSLAVNILVATRFDARGERREKKEK